LEELEAQWPGSTRIARLIIAHDEWLKTKFTDGKSWYDIISDSMRAGHDIDGPDAIVYDDDGSGDE
jgi:hypothetical protein